jgi:DNA topoisomerase-1
VQSVAVRMIVEREREIAAFVPQEYWTIDAKLTKEGAEAVAFLARLAASSANRRKRLEITSAAESQRLVDLLTGARFAVADVKRKEQRRRPQPYTTSTPNKRRRRLATAKRTMALAQQYKVSPPGEGQPTIITCTDSTHTLRRRAARPTSPRSSSALPPSPRLPARAPAAQEAHEAIRPLPFVAVWPATRAGRDRRSASWSGE